jgi:hypothetical protein
MAISPNSIFKSTLEVNYSQFFQTLMDLNDVCPLITKQYTLHTGWTTNTIHVLQFLDGLSLTIHGTVKSFGQPTYGLQH